MGFKVCLISHHFTNPKVLLDYIVKMTPNRSGKWKDMTAVIDPFEADVVVLLDGYSNVPYPKDRAYYFGQHPHGIGSFKPLADVPSGRAFPNKDYLNPGEWWLSFDYDYLMSLEPPKKNKDLIAVSTYYVDHKHTYTHRIQMLEETSKLVKFDIYGRQEENFKANELLNPLYKGVMGIKNFDALAGDHMVGKEMLLDYSYSIECDVGRDTDGGWIKNYYSERLYDSLLCWCMPFYFGSDNLDERIPRKSFEYIDITTPEKRVESARLIKYIIDGNVRDKNIDSIKIARERLLNEWQLWPFVYDTIKGTL
jgi:hypothetical protein